MPKTKISEFSATPGNNTDIDGINIAEGCAPSGINDAIRELMSQLKDFQAGTAGDSFNGPVGTTTAAAGAFTTLSASGAVTLSGGTANGVPYLNGSKVLTTGSALTFDGTTLATTGKFGITGSGSIPTASALEIGTNGAGTRFRYNVPTGGEHNFTENGSVISFQTASAHGWFAGGSEQMRLTSTGLGIGTSSPTAIVHASKSTASDTYFRATNSLVSSVFGTSASGETYVYNNGAYPIRFFTNDTERMRLDSSGNLGLGVTPSAWGSIFKAIDFSTTASLAGSSGGANLFNNAYYNGSDYIYKTTAASTRYLQSSGAHYWYTAPSGTAGNAITFTQAMTLDASGNLGIGTTSPAAKLELGAPNAINTTNTFRISNPYYNYWDITNGVNGVLAFSRGGSEHMRIDNSGNLLVGTTSTGNSNSKSFVANVANGYIVVNHLNGQGSGSGYASFGYNGGEIGYISQNGTTAVAYNTTSDYRLKENVQPMTGALAKVAALKPVTYKWKADGSDGEGFIAHELAEVCPHAVTGEKDAVDEEGNPKYQGIDTSFLVATLTAAIQEQQAMIQQLTARIEALEQA